MNAVSHEKIRTLLAFATGKTLAELLPRSPKTALPKHFLELAKKSFPDSRIWPKKMSDSLINAVPTSPLEAISRMTEWYEQLLEKEALEKHGAFYTPAALAGKMVAEAIAHCDHKPKMIADLSAGSGVFLIEAFRATKSITSLYGYDIDGNAIGFAKVLLQLCALKVGQSLRASKEIVDRQLQIADPLISLIEPRFDLIIGNPPYGLSRAQRLSTEYTNHLKKLYRGKIRGRINTYLLFMLRAYELLKPGGVMSLVVPNAWLGIDEAQPVRELLISSGALCEINSFKTSPFSGLGVEVITFLAKKESRSSSLLIKIFDDMHSALPYRTTTLEHRQILNDRSRRISLNGGKLDQALLAQIERECLPILTPQFGARASIALQVYGVGRGLPKQSSAVVKSHPFHVTEAIDSSCIPYLEGNDVRRFQINWSGIYLRYGEWMAEYHPIERYRTPRIIIREILGRGAQLLSAAYCEHPFTYNRSLLHIHASGKMSKRLLRALTVIFNSTFASYWILQRGRKSQRTKFPKIVARDLNEFPLPKNLLAHLKDLDKTYGRMTSNSINANAQQELDTAVYKAYGISRPAQKQIESHF